MMAATPVVNQSATCDRLWLGHRGRVRILGMLIAAVTLLALPCTAAAQGDDSMDLLGVVPRHGSLSFLPWEHIDTYTGNAVLSFADLVLPNDGGSVVAIQRVYNTKDGTWRWLAAPQLLYNGLQPFLVDANGNTQSLLLTETPNVYRTTAFARVTIASPESKLELPDGMTWYFPGQGGYATRREDLFGNVLDVVYCQDYAWAVDYLVQHVGTFTRTIDFEYANNDGNPTALVYGSRRWEYRWASFPHGAGGEFVNLASVVPPEGNPWTFDYTANTVWRPGNPGYPWFEYSMKVTTPGGGWVRYYSANGDRAPLDRSDLLLLRERTSGGGGTVDGTWTFTYADGGHIPSNDPGITTTVTLTGPGGFSISHLHKMLPPAPGCSDDGPDAPLHEAVVGDETTSIQWRWSVTIGDAQQGTVVPTAVELPERVTTTRNGHEYRRDFTYEDTAYNHFGQPSTITDTGNFPRSTSRAYRTFAPDLWLADRLSTEAIDNTVESSSTYDDLAFLLSRTSLGITTTFTRGDGGNVASQTDGRRYTTSYQYDRGMVSAVQTPKYTIDYEINDDGTIKSVTQRGQKRRFSTIISVVKRTSVRLPWCRPNRKS